MARWRKEPLGTGLSSVSQTERGLQLREGDEVVLHVDALLSNGRDVVGWYWYGLGKNTYASPKKTMEEAKIEANAFYKAYKARQPISTKGN